MIEVVVEIVTETIDATVELPLIGVTVTGVKDDVINGNKHTITDIPI